MYVDPCDLFARFATENPWEVCKKIIDWYFLARLARTNILVDTIRFRFPSKHFFKESESLQETIWVAHWIFKTKLESEEIKFSVFLWTGIEIRIESKWFSLKHFSRLVKNKNRFYKWFSMKCSSHRGRSKKFLDFDIVALSFLFDKQCPIME